MNVMGTNTRLVRHVLRYPRCLNHVTFSAMCGTIGCKQNVASECLCLRTVWQRGQNTVGDLLTQSHPRTDRKKGD
ncbi:hypothetical protein DPMN_193225 [Dreissena polymorpha]|uniref:Uncharacterized protein n=1 Tax=Dreissena polymorpha TaxID=45954 RepID=A0A9D3Y466_DREPO|nr:hypothetical protein DPMN_193225 [Dreissena polymorpha]